MALYPFTTATLTSLTAAGTTNSIKVNAQAVTFQVTVSSIGTNVQVRFEGSLDNQSFFNLDDEAQDTTISADGTTGYSLSGTPVSMYACAWSASLVGRLPLQQWLEPFEAWQEDYAPASTLD